MLSQEFVEEMKQALLTRKTELTESLEGFSVHTELGDDDDSKAQESEEDEVSQDIRATLKVDLAKIENALDKIEQGTYGTDDQGKEIGEARLRVLPWADKAI